MKKNIFESSIFSVCYAALLIVIYSSITVFAEAAPVMIAERDCCYETVEIASKAPESLCEPLLVVETYDMLYTEAEVVACAKLIYGEYGADWVSDYEKAKVVCTLVNRTKSSKWIDYVGSDDLMTQLTYPGQFHYHSWFPVTSRHYQIAFDVLWRASKIQQGCEDVEWETDALNYWGDGWVNHFY